MSPRLAGTVLPWLRLDIVQLGRLLYKALVLSRVRGRPTGPRTGNRCLARLTWATRLSAVLPALPELPEELGWGLGGLGGGEPPSGTSSKAATPWSSLRSIGRGGGWGVAAASWAGLGWAGGGVNMGEG